MMGKSHDDYCATSKESFELVLSSQVSWRSYCASIRVGLCSMLNEG